MRHWFRLTLLITALLASFESFSAQEAPPECLDRFKALISSPSPIKVALPDKILIEASRGESRKLFSATYQLWKREIDLSKIRPVVARLAQGKDTTLDTGQRSALKSARKIGAILRANFELFDKRHESPRELDEFVTAFGKLNDAIEAFESPDSKSAKTLAKAARRLLKSIDRFEEDSPEFEMRPSRKGSFAESLEKDYEEIRDIVREDEVPAEEFHDLRKDLKKFMNYFQVRHALEPSDETAAIYRFLFEVNEDLGAMHDEAVAMDLTGRKAYDATKIRIPRQIREKVQTFLDRTEIGN